MTATWTVRGEGVATGGWVRRPLRMVTEPSLFRRLIAEGCLLRSIASRSALLWCSRARTHPKVWYVRLYLSSRLPEASSRLGPVVADMIDNA